MKDVKDTGQFVACDFCNYGEETMGGCQLGSYSICGDCAETLSHPEDVDVWFDKEKTFRQNVLNSRQASYGSSEGTIEFIDCPEDMSFDEFLSALFGG